MSGGLWGEIFASLSFSAALVATISYAVSAKGGLDLSGKKVWQSMGNAAFLVHGFSVFGVIGTLFYLIYSHQYQYHYVWSHSSNELPVYYMISCFWEGQEGSFLLWTFWHVVLGFVLMARSREWRDAVMSVVSAVNLILASMILGINLDSTWSKGLFLLGLVVPSAFLAYRFWKQQDSFNQKGLLHLGGLVVALLSGFLVVTEKGGQFSWDDAPFSKDHLGYALFYLFWAFMAGWLVFLIVRQNKKG